MESRNKLPDWDSLKKDLGSSLTITENPDGTKDGRVEGKEALKKLYAMTRPSANAESDLGKEIQSGIPMTTLRDMDGNEHMVPSYLASKKARKAGLHEKPYWGRPALRWSGGKWYRRNGDKWELED